MKSIIVQGLLMGDEGKGSVVDFYSSSKRVKLVVRFNGGFQAAHNVVRDGKHHTFSQFGSGTLCGIPSFIDEHVIVEPRNFLREAVSLIDVHGITDPLSMVTMHPDCLVSTKFHAFLNLVREFKNHHGTCGVGIGIVREMWSKTGDGLRLSDLKNKKLARKKIDWIRQWCQDQIEYKEPYHDINCIDFKKEVDELCHATQFVQTGELDIEMGSDGVMIWEGSQGAALDQVHGTIPHTTYSNTLPTYAIEFCQDLGIEYEIVGVVRTYETRHGNGPMYMEKEIDIFDHNIDNGSPAGKFRTGELSLDKVEHYAKLCKANCLAVNGIDQYNHNVDRLGEILPIAVYGYGPSAIDKTTEKR